MKKSVGFTLIELIIVITILSILLVSAFPKMISVTDESQLIAITAIKNSLRASAEQLEIKIRLAPDSLNKKQNKYLLETGQNVRIRGRLADGLWDNTFAKLIDFNDITKVDSKFCDAETNWCVRQRGRGWFYSRGYMLADAGRGIVIFPKGYNVNQQKCYAYYINQNGSTLPEIIEPSIVGMQTSGC